MNKMTDKDLRKFGTALSAILGVFGAKHFFKGNMRLCFWFFGIGICVLGAGMFSPKLLKGVYICFQKITKAIGWVNTRIILILLYYLILTPIGLMMKILGKDTLDRVISKTGETYWLKRERITASKETLEKQF